MNDNKELFLNTIKEKEEIVKSNIFHGSYDAYFIKITEQNDEIEVQYNHNYDNEKIYLFHSYCGGKIIFENFKKYNILYCKDCNLRVEFPLYISEFKELKKYFNNKFKEIIKKVTRAELIDLEG